MSSPWRCRNCGFTHVAGLADETGAPLAAGSPCPGCGLALEAAPVTRTEHGLSSVRDYFLTLKEIHFEPGAFFRKLPLTGGLGRPLAFALITHWLASAISFLWGSALGGFFSNPLARLMTMGRFPGEDDSVDYPGRAAQLAHLQDRLTSWFWGAGSIIADPFLTLVKVLATAFLVYIGARLLVPRKVSYESSVRILCYGMAPAILASIPVIGAPVSSVWIVVATVAGAREAYRVGTGRAIVITLFPKILVMAIAAAILMTVILLFLGIISIAFM